MQNRKERDFEEELLSYMAKLSNSGSLSTIEAKMRPKQSLTDLTSPLDTLSEQEGHSKKDEPQKIRSPL